MGDLGDHAGQLHAGGAATDDHEGQQGLPLPFGAGALGRFEAEQETAAHLERVLDALEPRGIGLPLRMPEVGVPRAAGQNEVVPGDGTAAAVEGERVLWHVDAVHLCHDHRGVGLVAQHPANRHGDVGGIEHRRGHLIQQGLEQMVIGAVDECDPHIGFGQRARGREPSEPATDDDHMWSRVGGVHAGDAGAGVRFSLHGISIEWA